MSKSRLPISIQRFVMFFCREDLADTLLGDFEELYERRLDAQGQQRAKLLLFLDVLLFIRPFAIKRIFKNSNTPIMLSNHVKVSFRKIQKHRASALTKMLSISVGIVSVFFISLYIHHETSYDHFHNKRNRIYTLNTTVESPTGDLTFGLTATGVAPYLKSISPEIASAVRLNQAYGSHVFQHEEKRFIESENILFAEANFFEVFDFEVIDGNPREALDEPLKVVLTERAAQKYFGDDQAYGQALKIDQHSFTVSAVVKDIPKNSHLQFDFLLSLETFLASRPNAHDNWSWMPMNAFLLVNEGANIENLKAQVKAIPAYQEDGASEGYSVGLESFVGLHFSEIQKGKLEASGNMQNIYILAGVGIMILLLACFNYINLTTAVMSIQEKEVSIKKTIGASRRNIFQQFMVESLVTTGISTLFSALIILILFKHYEAFLNTNYGLEYLLTPIPLGLLISMPLLLAFMGGIYPALRFATITAGQTIRKKVTQNYLLNTRSLLLIFQFGITSSLIMGSIIIYAQLQFIQEQDLGFDHKQKVVIDFGPNARIGNQFELLSAEFGDIPGVEGVTFSSHIPGEAPNGVTTVLTDAEGSERTGDISLTLVDPNFINKYGLKIIAGRDFRKGESDVTSSLIVNESCARAYGFINPEEIIGHRFQQWGGDGKVIGVVSDFNYLSLHEDVGLLSLKIWPDQFQKITVNLGSKDVAQVLIDLEEKWNSLFPNIPFNYFFLDRNFREQYRTDDIFMTIINLFTAVALFVGLLGLISFTSFWVDRKQREMSIRKVLGAQVSQLLWQFYKQFTLPVILGFLAATPIAYLLGQNWIAQFAYQFDMSILVFVVPLIFILILVSGIIGAQTFRVIGDNPVDHLKEE